MLLVTGAGASAEEGFSVAENSTVYLSWMVTSFLTCLISLVPQTVLKGGHVDVSRRPLVHALNSRKSEMDLGRVLGWLSC